MLVKIIKRTAQLLRVIHHELYCLVCCLYGAAKVFLFFSKADDNRLEIGAGSSKKQHMLTADLDLASDYPFDLRVGLPFPDASINAIYAEHVLEHFTFRDVLMLLRECRRVMKPGAALKISVPDARIYLNAYASPDDFDHNVYCTHDAGLDYQLKINYVNYMCYMDGHHRHMFDEDSLLATLTAAGFKDVCIRAFDPGLDQEARRYESLYAQGVKR